MKNALLGIITVAILSGTLFPYAQAESAMLDLLQETQTTGGTEVIRLTESSVVHPGEFKRIELVCNEGEIFLENSNFVMTSPSRFDGFPIGFKTTTEARDFGNFGYTTIIGYGLEVDNTLGYTSEVTMEISIACVKPNSFHEVDGIILPTKSISMFLANEYISVGITLGIIGIGAGTFYFKTRKDN